jgi:hypothetical protein
VVNPRTLSNILYQTNRAQSANGNSISKDLSLLDKGNNSIIALTAYQTYTFRTAKEVFKGSGQPIRSNLCVGGVGGTVCANYNVTDVWLGMPGRGILSDRLYLITGPWFVKMMDHWLEESGSHTRSSPVPTMFNGYIILFSKHKLEDKQLLNQTTFSISIYNITGSKQYNLWKKSLLVGVGSSSLKVTGINLVGLLLLLTGLLSYVSMKDVDKIYRLLRLRGINRRMTLTTLFIPWLSITIVIGIIGILSGIGISMIYRMSLSTRDEILGSIAGLSRDINGVIIRAGDGYIDWTTIFSPLPWEVLLIFVVILIPILYFYRVTRGSPIQTMREV